MIILGYINVITSNANNITTCIEQLCHGQSQACAGKGGGLEIRLET